MALHGHVKKAVKKVVGTVTRGAEAVADVAASAARATTIKPKKVVVRGTKPARDVAKAVASVSVKVAKSAKRGAKREAKGVEKGLSEALGALKAVREVIDPGKRYEGLADRINEDASRGRKRR